MNRAGVSLRFPTRLDGADPTLAGMTCRAVATLAAVLMATSLATIAASPRACACSCLPHAHEEVSGFDAVFAGVPTRRITRGDDDLYKFDVKAVYTGDVGKTVTVSTSSVSAACGKSFELGEEVLVFSKRNDSDGTFGASSCSPSGSTSTEVKEATRKVYGDPRPPDQGAPTASLPGPGVSVARGVGIAAGGMVFGAVVVAGIIVWRRRDTAT